MELIDTIPQDVSEASARRVEQQRVWVGIAALAAAALLFVQGVLAARALGPADFGNLAIIVAAVTAFRAVVSLRTRGAVLRYLNDALVDRDFAYAGASLKAAALLEAVVTLAAYVALWLLAPAIAHAFVRDADLTHLLRVYALVIPFGLVSQTALGVLQYFGRFDIEMLVRVAERAAAAAATVGAVLVGASLDAFVVAAAIGPCVAGLLFGGLGVAEAYKRLGERWALAPLRAMAGRWAGLLGAALRGSLTMMLAAITKEGDTLWMAWYATPIVAGYYALAQSLAGVAMVPAGPFAQRAFPHVARLASQQRWNEAYAIRSHSVMLVGVGVAVVLLVFGINGSELIGEVYGRVYAPAADPLFVLLGAAGILAITMWGRPILLASGLAPTTLLTGLVTAGCKVGAALLLIPRYGLMGCAFAAGLASVVGSGFMAVRAHIAARHGLHAPADLTAI